NEATGALEVVDVGGLGDLLASNAATRTEESATALFAHRSDKEFAQLGVDPELLPLLRVMQNEDQLEPLLAVLPQGQADALIMLTGQEPTDVLYAALVGHESPKEVDTDDLAAAVVAPASRSQF